MHVTQLQQTSNMWKEIDLDLLYLYDIYISFIESLHSFCLSEIIFSLIKVAADATQMQGTRQLFCLGFKSRNQHAEIFIGVQ